MEVLFTIRPSNGKNSSQQKKSLINYILCQFSLSLPPRARFKWNFYFLIINRVQRSVKLRQKKRWKRIITFVNRSWAITDYRGYFTIIFKSSSHVLRFFLCRSRQVHKLSLFANIRKCHKYQRFVMQTRLQRWIDELCKLKQSILLAPPLAAIRCDTHTSVLNFSRRL